MTISSPGVGSNLDVTGIVSQLMAVESLPMTTLANKEAGYQAKLTAYGTLKGALASFQSALQALATQARFTANKTSVADTSVFSASADSDATAGSYNVEVGLLAQAQKLKSLAFSASGSTVGSGKITIDFGAYSGDTFTLNPDKAAKEITIAPGQNSLAGIRDAINAANAGVTATIINDGTGYRLMVSSADSGAANALRIAVDDDDGTDTDASGLSQLVFDGRTSGVKNLTQAVAAQNAELTIDGIAISKASNTITDAIEGVTLNLAKGGSSTLTVSRDSADVTSAVQSFVNAYNDANKVMKDLSAYDASTKQSGTLQGDSSVRSIQAQLRGVLNSALTHAGGGLTTLSDIGVSFQKDGTLALDSSKLQKVIGDNTKDISTLFAAVGKPTDSLISFIGSTSSTKAGAYSVNITRLATQATVIGDVVLGVTTTITTGVNDTLNATIDGTAVTVTLAAGGYTPAQLAAEIQSKLNGASALTGAGIAVTASVSGGKLALTSTRYGSASKIESITGNAAGGTFGSVDYTSGTGVDVAGTIGGVAATGSGQTLTGTGEAGDLSITVTGGATGDRGTVKFAQGYAYQLDNLIEEFLDSDGTITGRTDGINSSIKDIGKQREALQRRLDMIEERYFAQFTALDAMLSSLQNTSNFLTQQLASLPKYDN